MKKTFWGPIGNNRMRKIFFASGLILFSTSRLQAAKKYEEINLGIWGGFGRQKNSMGVTSLSDGTPIVFDQDFIKSFKLSGLMRLNKKYAIGLEVGFSYNFNIAYTANSSKQTKLGISLPESGSEYYTIWHVSANVYRTLWLHHRFTLNGYGGMGLEIFPYNNYYKEITTDPHFNPDSKTEYTHYPSQVNKHPIIFFNAGLELHYKTGKRSSLAIQPALYFGTKPFLRDEVRIETPTGQGSVQTPMSGTRAMFSIGYCRTIN